MRIESLVGGAGWGKDYKQRSTSIQKSAQTPLVLQAPRNGYNLLTREGEYKIQSQHMTIVACYKFMHAPGSSAFNEVSVLLFSMLTSST